MTDLLDHHYAARPPIRPVPDGKFARLYHYTSYRGALGIAESEKLWATNIHYLNDYEEFKHAIEIATSVFYLMRPSQSPQINTLIDRIAKRFESIGEISIYVACFSEEDDVLSQWRGFAAGGGIAIGFIYDELKEIAEKHSLGLVKCVYKYDEKAALIKSSLARSISKHADWSTATDKDFEVATRDFIDRFFFLAASFKHQAFSEEKEWRVVSAPMPSTNAHIGMRGTNSMLIPHFEVDLNVLKRTNDKGQRILGFDRFVVGPTKELRLIVTSIGILVSRRNIRWGTIGRSFAPYRTL